VVVTGRAVAGEAGDYEFDLGARLPLERVNLVLPDTNSVLFADFKSRPDEKAAWRFVTHVGVYRVTNANGEQSNAPIDVPLDSDRYWRVHLSGQGGTQGVRLQGSFPPSEIEFLAQGKPPFMLAYGSSSIVGAPTDLSAIPGGPPIAAVTVGSRNALGGEARLAAPRGPLDNRTLLSALLVVAFAALGTIAARRARDRRR
jgi:hypothetical protein